MTSVNSPNKVGLPTKQRYSPEQGKISSDIIRDTNGQVNDLVKESIDTAISNIREHIEQGQEIAFAKEGYGQEMLEIEKNTGNQYAPKTFLYLSEQLYKNFGYVNPGYLTNTRNNQLVKESYAGIQGNQNITDLEIQNMKELTDVEVREFMKNCI